MRKLAKGETLVWNRRMSVDPYMRRRMNVGKFDLPPFEVGRALSGEVVESRSTTASVGAYLQHHAGWRDLAVVRDTNALVVDPGIAPLSAYLVVLGIPGLTAYVRLLDVAGLYPRDTVISSGPAGAVGGLVGQLAHARGHRVIGSADSAAKHEWLCNELGFEEAFDYHGGDVSRLLSAATPDGIDVHFDNVGYKHPKSTTPMTELIRAVGHHRRLQPVRTEARPVEYVRTCLASHRHAELRHYRSPRPKEAGPRRCCAVGARPCDRLSRNDSGRTRAGAEGVYATFRRRQHRQR